MEYKGEPLESLFRRVCQHDFRRVGYQENKQFVALTIEYCTKCKLVKKSGIDPSSTRRREITFLSGRPPSTFR